jgi:hypothetical protein
MRCVSFQDTPSQRETNASHCHFQKNRKSLSFPKTISVSGVKATTVWRWSLGRGYTSRAGETKPRHFSRSFSMIRATSLKLSVATVVLGFAAPIALAQTGPSTPPINGVPGTPVVQPGPGGNNNVIPQNRLTAERLANFLRGQGTQVDVKTFANGGATLTAIFNQDGWRYIVEFEFLGGGNRMNIICPLGNSSSQFSAAQLLELMKKTYDMNAIYRFLYRDQDKRLCLEDPQYDTNNLSEAVVRDNVNRLIRVVRETYQLWNTANWPIGGTTTASAGPSAVIVQPTLPQTK